MAANPILDRSPAQAKISPPSDLKTVEERRRWWIARGNRVLWGEEPCKDGSYCEPRRDMEWRHDGNSYYLSPRNDWRGRAA